MGITYTRPKHGTLTFALYTTTTCRRPGMSQAGPISNEEPEVHSHGY